MMDGDGRHFLQGKTIIVAGGGIAGSAFAAALNKNWDPSTRPPTIRILERDVQDVSRQRADYTMSLLGHDATGGLVALKKLGLLDAVVDKSISSTSVGGSFKIWGADWTERASFRRRPLAGLPASSIRISRRELRGILQEAAAASENITVEWDIRCTSASPAGGGRVNVKVRRGGSEVDEEMGCDLLVVADGASSRIRASLRPADRLEYCGAVLRGGLARFDKMPPELLRRDWGFQLSGDGVSCFYSPVDEHSVLWAIGHMEADEAPPLQRDRESEAAEVIQRGRQLGARFHEPFGTVIDHTDRATVIRLNARDKTPFAHDTDALEDMPAVFIGDSNHALSPFSGYGANLALDDGWDLAEKLCAGSSLGQAVGAYDAASLPRSTSVLKASRRRLWMGHCTGWRLWVYFVILALSKFVASLLGRR